MFSKLMKSMAAGMLVVAIATGVAAGSTYEVDQTHSSAELRHAFRNVNGAFSEFSGTVVYDPANVEKSSVEISLPVQGLTLQEDGREIGIKGEQIFDMRKHPDIVFKSTSVRLYGNRLMATGQLTMLGVTREVVVPIEVLGRATYPKSNASAAAFAAELKIKLSDFGVDTWTDAAVILGDEIKIKLNVVGVDRKREVVKSPGEVPKS